MANYVKQNYYYMLEQLEMNYADFQRDAPMASTTESRIRKGDPEKLRDSTLETLVNYYNRHGHLLYPSHVDIETFKRVPLEHINRPRWENRQIVGDYVCLHLSKRGTGKLKAMVLSITETPEKKLEARAIDIVQSPAQSEAIMKQFLKTDDISAARELHKQCLEANHRMYPILRGSNYLTGTVIGSGDLVTITLSDEYNTHEMRISTLLTHYLDTNKKRQSEPYPWRGGAAIANVTDIHAWPYSMIIGMIRLDHWNYDPESLSEFTQALLRMHTYQRKENTLALHGDIDTLFYEVFTEIKREKAENTATSSQTKTSVGRKRSRPM